MNKYKVCARCVMDESDQNICFNENGICNHCIEAEYLLKKLWFPNKVGEKKLDNLLFQIKKAGTNKKYDCIMGLSGGVDSSYLLHLATKIWNLRVLAVHVNAGWNSETAESNIEKLVNKLNVDLYTYVVNWEEMRNLQIAYLKSGVINQDIPQDHVFFAQLFKRAAKEKITYVLTGHNLATESILPKSWGYDAMDSKQLKHIHRKFGVGKLNSYTTISLTERLLFTFILNQKVVKPLNFINYDKQKAKDFLNNEYQWQDYGVKHGESVFTRFYQNYWLPIRYGFDKRKAHLSSLIISGFITRADALRQLEEPLYDNHLINIDKQYICNKLEVSEEVFDAFLYSNKVDHSAYPSNEFIFDILMKIYNKIRRV